MAQIPATCRQLKNSFNKHYGVYKTIHENIKPAPHPMTRRLLLFYAVESGLKCFLLNKIHKNTTEDFSSHHEYQYLTEHGHDIKKMMQFVNLGGDDYKLGHFTPSGGKQIEPEQLHQLWRYGIEISPPGYDEEAEKVLKNAANWLVENIDR